MKPKTIILSLVSIYALSSLTGCGSTSTETTSTETSESSSSSNTTDSSDASSTESSSSSSTDSSNTVTYESHEVSDDDQWDASTASAITLKGSSVESSASGVSISGTTVTISQAGTYRITGTLSDGNIIVDTSDEESVKLVFDGVDISSSTTAPIFVQNAEKTIIIVAEGSDNSLSDASTYVYANADEDEPSAAIFSKDDLSIYGSGSLDIEANYNDAIKSKDGLVINANISIDSVDDGIIGKDYLVINGGEFTIDAEGDGFKSSNEEDSSLGYIAIADGTFEITAGSDAMQAETNLQISDGTFDLTTGGGSGTTLGEDDSAKGLKAGTDMELKGGSYTINSADDAIHSNGTIAITQGDYTLTSGDDGIHADESLTISDGDITVTDSYEGIESAIITIDGGELHLTASDDGLNVAGGSNSSTTATGGRPGQDRFSSSGDYYFYMNGGKVVIEADGDGVDVNGDIEMTGGTILVNGPTSSGNGALDYDGTFNISGGLLVATGSSGMAQAPSSSSSQYSVLMGFNSTIPANTMVHIETLSGENILSFMPTKAYQSLAFSSPELSNNTSYYLYYGGSDSGDENDGLYTSGSYTAGTLYGNFTITSSVTSNMSTGRR